MMLPRWRVGSTILLCLLALTAADDGPAGLINKDSSQDLQAEATNSGGQAQKREASTLLNSYGEPLPADAYGPPAEVQVSEIQLPGHAVYGPPELQPTYQEPQSPPPGAYGPPSLVFPTQSYEGPSSVVFPSQNYEGPPPPITKHKQLYGPPKFFGPPKQNYGPPKLSYGPPKYFAPKKTFGIPKQSLPKPTYGVPFKQKILSPKPIYGAPLFSAPKPVYPGPKPVYGPPKVTYGTPVSIPVQSDFSSVTLTQNIGGISQGLDLNLPAPIYGTPLVSLPGDLKPDFPIPSDTYGPPGQILNEQVVTDVSNIHYGPPQPDPNPKPPHPGIPAPPTPPHVLYDGWKPIPGVSLPIGHVENVEDQYGPPPPPPVQEIHIDLEQPLPNEGHHQFNNLEVQSAPSIQQNQQFHGQKLEIHNQFGQIDGQSQAAIHHNHQFEGQKLEIHEGHIQAPSIQQNQFGGQKLEIHNQFGQNGGQSHNQFGSAQITTGYSSVHQDALANVDLNSIVGGDTNQIDQSKAVFEAHYTDHDPQGDLALIQSGIPNIPSGPSISTLPSVPSLPSIPTGRPHDTYGAPPLDSLSGGHYPASINSINSHSINSHSTGSINSHSIGSINSHSIGSINSHSIGSIGSIGSINSHSISSIGSIRQFGAKGHKGLIPPSGIYGVPPGSHYGAPPKPPPSHLPIPYGTYSGGGLSIHTGGSTPRQPIKFREPVPDGLLQQIGQTTHGKDHHGIDNLTQGPTYLPPPIRDVKDVNLQSGNLGGQSVSLSIEPTSLYSLPHSGNPLNFQNVPSGTYGSPIDSYSVPLLTVGDHTASGSSSDPVTATIDGINIDTELLANLSSLDAAAILKHCPYHEAILKAARSGEKIPADLASKYVASLSSLGSSLSKNVISQQNSLTVPAPGSESVSYNSKDLSTASHTLVETILPSEKPSKFDKLKSKSLRETNKYKDEKLQYVSDQIFKTSEKIKNLNEETKKLQQKIVSTNHNLNDISVQGNQGSYSIQIQSSNGKDSPTIPHDQLLSEGLLQSILQAIEQPGNQNQIVQTSVNIQSPPLNQPQPVFKPQPVFHNPQIQQLPNQQGFNFQQTTLLDGLTLPDGYEPVDRTKTKKDQEIQASVKHEVHRGDIPECDAKGAHSIRHSVIVAPEETIDSVKPVQEVDENDVAIFFGNDDKEPVTEISVATSISENIEEYGKQFGDKIKKA